MLRPLRVVFFILFITICFLGCKRWFHKECRSNYQINKGEIVASLAFNCLMFDPDAKGDTSVYIRAGQFDTFWSALQAKYNGDCPKPNIDFSQHSVLTFHQQYYSTEKILRDVFFDHVNKQVIYTITLFKCQSSLTHRKSLGLSENMVVVNAIPAGYTVVWKTVHDE